MAATIIEGNSLTIVCSPRRREWPHDGPHTHTYWEADAVISKRDGSGAMHCTIMTALQPRDSGLAEDFVRGLFGGFFDDRVVTDKAALADVVLSAIGQECRRCSDATVPYVHVGDGREIATVEIAETIPTSILRPGWKEALGRAEPDKG